jgi:hypothetical protein
MPLRARQIAMQAMTKYPLYRVLPPGDIRSCGSIIYHVKQSPPEKAFERIRAMGSVPTRYLRPAVAAGRSAFRTGNDDVLDMILTSLEVRFPEAGPVHVLRCDLHAFHGRYEDALNSASHARLLRPSDKAATARVVRLGYHVLDASSADNAALEALRRFPHTSEVLWAVGKTCSSPEQYERIQSTWDAQATDPGALPRAVRPLATAATRAGQIDAAIALYKQAIQMLADGWPGSVSVSDTRLEGRNPWSAIEDLCQVLDGAGVPFFFAAGTALGLVRAGGPLGADGDIDVGIFDGDWDQDALEEMFVRHPRFELDFVHPGAKKVGLRHRGGSPVDLFRFYKEAGRLWHDAVFVRWHNSPFRVTRREIRGLSLPLPEDTDQYLTENYSDWRIPNPDFDAFTDDAPNVETTWPDYLRLHYVRRAYKRLASGDVTSACHDLQRADEHELATRVRVNG